MYSNSGGHVRDAGPHKCCWEESATTKTVVQAGSRELTSDERRPQHLQLRGVCVQGWNTGFPARGAPSMAFASRVTTFLVERSTVGFLL